MTLKGNLEVLNLSDIFQSLSLNQHTGTLRVTDGKREKLIYFAQGEITLLSSDKKLMIGEMLVASGKISQEDLDYALAQQKRTKKRLGEILVEEGFVTEDDVVEVVRRQIEEEIYDLFLWKKAEFEFLIDYCPDKLKSPAYNVTKLQFNTNSLIMEALRRLDEWELISKEIPTLKEVYKVVNPSPEALEDIDLPARIKAEIKLIDGERTVEQIAEETALSEFELCKLLCELKRRRVIAPLSPQELADKAEECFQKGKFRQASALYERLAEVLPKNLQIRWHLAESLKAFGDEPRALEQYEFIAKKLEGSRDRAELARAYRAILDLAPQRRDIAERLRALGRVQWKRAVARALAYAAIVTIVAAGIVVFGVGSETTDRLVERVKTVLGVGGGPVIDAARLEQAAQELNVQATQLLEQGKLAEAFDVYMKLLRNYPKSGPASLVVLPLRIDTIPTGKEVWIKQSDEFVYRGRSPGVFRYSPDHEDVARTPLHVEIRDSGRVLWRGTLDPAKFNDLRIDLFHRPLWREPTDGAVRGRPVFAGAGRDAAVFFTSLDGYIRGLRIADRTPTARFPLRENVDPFGEVVSDLALAGDLLVAGSLDGKLLAFDTARRVKLFEVKVSSQPLLASPAVLDDGQLAALGGDDGEIYFVSLPRRALLGRANVTCSHRVTAIVAAGTRVLVASRDNWLRSIHAGTFALDWPLELSDDILAAPAFDERSVVAGDARGEVVCVEREKGIRRWRSDVGAPVAGVCAAEGRAYVTAATGTVQALDLESGRVEWKVAFGRGPGRPVAAGGRLFVATASPAAGLAPGERPLGFLHAIDAKTGQELWTARLPAAVRGEPAVFEGHVYVGCEDGSFYCFEVQ